MLVHLSTKIIACQRCFFHNLNHHLNLVVAKSCNFGPIIVIDIAPSSQLCCGNIENPGEKALNTKGGNIT